MAELTSPTVAWVSPWDGAGGIETYSGALFPAVQRAARETSPAWILESVSLDRHPDVEALVRALVERRPQVIHFQHEFGLYGGKLPPGYFFPKLVRALRERLSDTRLVATAHTVLDENFVYPTQGRSPLAGILRQVANATVVPFLRQRWMRGTWGGLDAVTVHSASQRAVVEAAGARRVFEVPHFVPDLRRDAGAAAPRAFALPADDPVILVFGFFTPDKGQDIAIEAFARMHAPAHLVLAGGVRRKEDQPYMERCLAQIRASGREASITVTGFVSWSELAALAARATLALLPFRETSGSGSLADVLAHGLPILASDLPLNLEVAERVSNSATFFRASDPADAARALDGVLAAPARLAELRAGARAYRATYRTEKIADALLRVYEEVIGLRK